jgi:hypothetical protein
VGKDWQNVMQMIIAIHMMIAFYKGSRRNLTTSNSYIIISSCVVRKTDYQNSWSPIQKPTQKEDHT